MKIAVALFDYDAVTEDELTFDQGDKFAVVDDTDQDWWLVKTLPYEDEEDFEEEEGYVPKSYIKLEEASGNNETERRIGRERSATSATAATTASRETLFQKSFQQFPSGFRPSAVEEYKQHGKAGLKDFVFPRLSKDGYSFVDFHSKDGKLVPSEAATNLAVSIVEARSIPFPGAEFSVKGRYVNICLFDRMNFVGNVWSVPVIYDGKKPQKWRCAPKTTKLFSRNEPNVCFVRARDQSPDIHLLFELVIVVNSPEDPEEFKKISSGWGLLPLFLSDGTVIESKQYEIKLFGGSPYERDVPLVSAEIVKPSILPWTKKFPRLIVDVWKLGQSALERLNKLPSPVICSVSSINSLSVMIDILHQKFIRNRDTTLLEPVFLPAVSLFLHLLQEPDYLLSFARSWEERQKLMSRADKKSMDIVQAKFFEALTFYWPNISSAEVPKYNDGYDGKLDDRYLLLSRYVADGPTQAFGKNPAKLAFKPFTTDECIVSLKPQ